MRQGRRSRGRPGKGCDEIEDTCLVVWSRDRGDLRRRRRSCRHGAAHGGDDGEGGLDPPRSRSTAIIQDNLRWNKNVYKVPSGGTIHVVNMAADEGPHTFTIVKKTDAPRTGLQVVNCRICNSWRRRTGRTRTATLRRSSRSSRTASGSRRRRSVDKPGDSGVTGKGKKGESIDLHRDAPRRDEALDDVPDPPVDAGGDRRQLSIRSNAAGSRGRGRSPAPSRSSRSSQAARPAALAAGPDARLLGRRRTRDLEHRAERARRDHGHAGPAGGLGPQTRSSTAATRRTGASRSTTRRATSADGLLIPGPADPRARRRPAADPLQEHGHAAQRPALDALPRRPLQADVRRRLCSRLLRARTPT